jgi:hypothetical protein
MNHGFPPRRDYASVSTRDLLDAREATHVYFSTLPNVIATAIGRYLIRKEDWYASHAPNDPRPDNVAKPTRPRTLDNSVVRPWSWPSVLVFVRKWEKAGSLGTQEVPRAIHLPDGRVVPTCVILAEPDESLPPPAPGPSQTSGLVGGGFACLREHQGTEHVGSFGCIVSRQGTFYVLTNRHVAGLGDEEVRAYSHGAYHKVGKTTDIGVGDIDFTQGFPGWPGTRTCLTFDAGLVRIDDVNEWTSQVWGIGEIAEPFDATECTVSVDLIGCPVRAYGATSGPMEGEIRALFYRYASLGGEDRATDVLIGPRVERPRMTKSVAIPKADIAPPLTRPGDSGTLWFYDPPAVSDKHDDIGGQEPPARGARAPRLIPIAMQWGGSRFLSADGKTSSAFALGAFLSTLLRELRVDVVRDWSTGYSEYWGKIGHFSIGWKACDQANGQVRDLMQMNQARIGFDDKTLGDGAAFKIDPKKFVPLADVPDYVWIGARQSTEPMQHFADIDIEDINGGPDMLSRCLKDSKDLSATHWKEYFDGFESADVGPDAGTLPFRVWQIWEDMVEYLKKKDAMHFVAAAGILAHYVGDASQPLHCSYLHHGRPPMLKHGGRSYPIRKMLHGKENPAYTAFHKTPAAKIHGIYEEGMFEVQDAAKELLSGVSARLKSKKGNPSKINSGHDAAMAVIELMHRSRTALSPTEIIDADDPSLTVKQRQARLWANAKIRTATMGLLADSVQVLADLWESAWRVGNGKAIPASKRRPFTEPELSKIYRTEKNFLPSLTLGRMAAGGRFEP